MSAFSWLPIQQDSEQWTRASTRCRSAALQHESSIALTVCAQNRRTAFYYLQRFRLLLHLIQHRAVKPKGEAMYSLISLINPTMATVSCGTRGRWSLFITGSAIPTDVLLRMWRITAEQIPKRFILPLHPRRKGHRNVLPMWLSGLQNALDMVITKKGFLCCC